MSITLEQVFGLTAHPQVTLHITALHNPKLKPVRLISVSAHAIDSRDRQIPTRPNVSTSLKAIPRQSRYHIDRRTPPHTYNLQVFHLTSVRAADTKHNCATTDLSLISSSSRRSCGVGLLLFSHEKRSLVSLLYCFSWRSTDCIT